MLLFHTIQRLRAVSQTYKFKILRLHNINYHPNFDDYRKRNIVISISEIKTVAKWLL